MSTVSKASMVLSAAVGVAFLALTGCASQQSGAATPANLPNNCKVISNSCKGKASCKGVHACKGKAKHVVKSKAKITTNTKTNHTTTTTTTSAGK